jgi:hypothetical protein
MQKSTTGNFHGVLLTKRMPTVCPENSIGSPAGCVVGMIPLWDDGAVGKTQITQKTSSPNIKGQVLLGV